MLSLGEQECVAVFSFIHSKFLRIQAHPICSDIRTASAVYLELDDHYSKIFHWIKNCSHG